MYINTHVFYILIYTYISQMGFYTCMFVCEYIRLYISVCVCMYIAVYFNVLLLYVACVVSVCVVVV